ncbi:hypothetical protein [Mycobacterium hubeiense]|uniref:hypothetical protein n=1 Tax=Mycobacterium hubeiense TaxID=1867256 RepID=UPI000C7F3159|nr:hypothetical protein [Mycobacterium sp. QGD 101]
MSPAAFLACGIAFATVGYLYARKSATAAGLIAGSMGVLLGCAAALYGTYQLTTLPGRVVLISSTLAGLIWISYHLVTYCLDEKRPSTGMHAAAQTRPHG